MKNSVVAIGVVAIIISSGAGYFVRSAKQDVLVPSHDMNAGMTMTDIAGGTQLAMQAMMAGLADKTGDAFDKAFLAEMILHHEGAIEMAQAALRSAKHEELKSMANNIISAQTAEVSQMKAWRTSWYGASSQ